MDTHQNTGLATMKSYGDVRTFLERSPIRIGLAVLTVLSMSLAACGGGGSGSTAGLPPAAATPTPSIVSEATPTPTPISSIVDVTPIPVSTPVTSGDRRRVFVAWGSFDPTVPRDVDLDWSGTLSVNDPATVSVIASYWFNTTDAVSSPAIPGASVGITSTTRGFMDGLNVQLIGDASILAVSNSTLTQAFGVTLAAPYNDFVAVDSNYHGVLITAIHESVSPGEGFVRGDFHIDSVKGMIAARAILTDKDGGGIGFLKANIPSTFKDGDSFSGIVTDLSNNKIADFSGTIGGNKIDGSWSGESSSGSLHATYPVIQVAEPTDGAIVGYFMGYIDTP